MIYFTKYTARGDVPIQTNVLGFKFPIHKANRKADSTVKDQCQIMCAYVNFIHISVSFATNHYLS